MSLLAGVLVFLSVGPANAQVSSTNSSIQLWEVKSLPGPQIQFLLRGDDTNGSYAVESSPVVGTGASWVTDTNAVFFNLSNTTYRVTTAAPASGQRFYRVVAGGTDTDGDGLSDAEEQVLHTDPAKADTDGDGFSDGLEVAYGAGADPLDPSSMPPVSFQPALDFDVALSEGTEGSTLLELGVTSSKSLTSPLNFAVALMSTATLTGPEPDFELASGPVVIDGTHATIPLVIVDDSLLEDTELIVMDLEDDPGGRYHVGARPRHTVMLKDNDATWIGTLRTDYGESTFNLKIVQTDAQKSASLVSVLDTNNVAGNRGVGTIPPGEWPVNLTMAGTNFLAVSDPIPSGSSQLFNTSLERTFTFQSGLDSSPSEVPDTVAGGFEEVIAPTTEGFEFLRTTNRGFLLLVREPPRLPSPDPILVPTP